MTVLIEARQGPQAITEERGGAQALVVAGENTAQTRAERVRAEGAADRAESQATRAEIAAALGGYKASDTTDGLANTFSGEDFWIDNGDGTASTYRNVAGSAVLLGRTLIDPTATFDLLMAQISPSASDQSATLQSLVDAAAAANQDVNILRPGIYKVADIVLPARADGAALKIRCAEGVILDGSPGTDMFLLDSAGIDLEGGAGQNTRHFVVAVSALAGTDQDQNYPAAALLDGPVDRLRLAGVSLSAVKTALYYISNQNADAHIIDRIELTDCEMDGGWAFASVSCAFRHLKINGVDLAGMDASDAVNAAGTLNFQHMVGGISIGKGHASAQPFVRSMDVRNLRVLGVSDDRDGANGAYNTYGIALFGRNLTMDTAYVEDVSNRQCNDAEGIYLKVDGYELTNVSGLNAGVKTGMLMLKGDNLASEAVGDKSVGRNGSVYDWRFENTRAFGDTHPDHGYSFGDDFPAIFLQHDYIEIGKGEAIGCGCKDAAKAVVYSSDNRILQNLVVRDVACRESIGMVNIGIFHAGDGGGVFDCKAFGHTGAQLDTNTDTINVLVRNKRHADLQFFSVERNMTIAPAANGTGKTYNVRVTAEAGNSNKRTRYFSVIGNKGRNVDYGDFMEVLTGSPDGTMVAPFHDRAEYASVGQTAVTIPAAATLQRVGPNSAAFMNGRSGNVDITSRTAGQTSTFAVTCPGARVGDHAFAEPDTFVQGWEVRSARVSADDTVQVTMINNTGGTYDPPSQRYLVWCERDRSAG